MQRLHTSGETVFNFEVADDHSYVAGGFVVHNCDGHAAANLHGMGPGVYPRGQHPYPAHPETLSYLTVVFVDQITAADRAGQQTMGDWLRAQPAGLQDAVLGQHKGAALRDGQLLESEITTPWRDVRARLEAPP